MDLAVGGLVHDLSLKAREENRKRAVDEQGKTVVVGIEWRACGIKVPTPFITAGWRHSQIAGSRNGERGFDHRQKTFVGMEMLVFIPVYAGQPEYCAEDENESERDGHEPAAQSVGLFWLLQFELA